MVGLVLVFQVSLAFLVGTLLRRPLMAIRDPRLGESLRFENA